MLEWNEEQELRLQSGLQSLQAELGAEYFSEGQNASGLQALQAALSAYGQILLQWHAAFHLLGEQNPDDFVSLHLLDSVVGALFLQSQPDLLQDKSLIQLVDVGSGLGLPGIPLALWFTRCLSVQAPFECYLLEPASRRSNILRSMVAELGLREQVAICEHPVEQWPKGQATADARLLATGSSEGRALRLVTCRAFRPLQKNSWKQLSAPRQGLAADSTDVSYSVMLYKGNWQQARAELQGFGREPQAQLLYTLPQCGHQRSLFYWEL